MAPAPTDQVLGVGDGARTVFQLVKTGAEGAPDRVISKPDAASVRLAVDGIETNGAEVDGTTGRVTFETPPTEGATVTAGFRFDVPVRFDTDRLEVTLESFDAGRMAAVPLIEIRV